MAHSRITITKKHIRNGLISYIDQLTPSNKSLFFVTIDRWNYKHHTFENWSDYNSYSNLKDLEAIFGTNFSAVYNALKKYGKISIKYKDGDLKNCKFSIYATTCDLSICERLLSVIFSADIPNYPQILVKGGYYKN